MAFDGIIMKSVLAELNSCLLGGKINKVFEPNKNEILLGIYANGKNHLLTICIDSVNCRLHLTTTTKPNPLNAPNFCMLLRKYLIGMRIKSLSNPDLERIVTIELEGYNELNDLVNRKLIIELMGKHSNLILVNETNHIIDSMRHLDTFSHATRDILPAHEYRFPSSDKKSILEETDFSCFYSNIAKKLETNSFDTVLSNTYTGISKLFVHSLLASLGLTLQNLTPKDIELFFHTLRQLLGKIGTSCLSCIPYQDSERKKQDYVITLKEKSSPLSINFFLDDFYSKKEEQEEFKTYRNTILKLILTELKKYTKRLENMNQKLLECENMDQYRLYGELLTTNLYRIKEENVSFITVENYYNNNEPIVIPLDKSISPSKNAKKYFKKYAKLKNALSIVTEQKINTSKEIEYIESIIYELESSKNILEVNAIYSEISETLLFKERLSSKKASKKEKTTKKKAEELVHPFEFHMKGYTVYVGKNNKQNDYLTLKFAHHNDLWFHTKEIHGSHVILKTEGKEIEEEIINQCASLAAYYSKASFSSNVPVDYTYVRYVKKPSGAKPGMVIYTNYTTVNVHPKPIEELN